MWVESMNNKRLFISILLSFCGLSGVITFVFIGGTVGIVIASYALLLGVGCVIYDISEQKLYKKLKREREEWLKTRVAKDIFEDIGDILQEYSEAAEKDKSEYGDLLVTDITCAIGNLRQKYFEVENADM